MSPGPGGVSAPALAAADLARAPLLLPPLLLRRHGPHLPRVLAAGVRDDRGRGQVQQLLLPSSLLDGLVGLLRLGISCQDKLLMKAIIKLLDIYIYYNIFVQSCRKLNVAPPWPLKQG